MTSCTVLKGCPLPLLLMFKHWRFFFFDALKILPHGLFKDTFEKPDANSFFFLALEQFIIVDQPF